MADMRARKGKLKTYGVKVHDKNREENILKLHQLLKNKTFKTSDYATFIIHEPKERVIFRLPYFPDRIVHHAIMNVLEPIWVSVFTVDSFSCIKGRGISGAMRKVKKAIKDPENARYCLKIDIKKFYPSIDHDVLKSVLRKKLKCKDTLALLDSIIDSADGVPIGNYLSQYFANLLLTYFDHWIKEVKRIKYYFRYADDMVFLSSSKEELHDLLQEIKNYIKENLSLELKSNYQVFPLAKDHKMKGGRGLDFVGFVFYFNEMRMRKRIKQNLCRVISRINKKKFTLELSEEKKLNAVPFTAKHAKKELAPWLGWAKNSDSDYLLKKLLKKEYYEICILSRRASKA